MNDKAWSLRKSTEKMMPLSVQRSVGEKGKLKLSEKFLFFHLIGFGWCDVLVCKAPNAYFAWTVCDVADGQGNKWKDNPSTGEEKRIKRKIRKLAVLVITS